jgi:hypothetical protein
LGYASEKSLIQKEKGRFRMDGFTMFIAGAVVVMVGAALLFAIVLGKGKKKT